MMRNLQARALESGDADERRAGSHVAEDRGQATSLISEGWIVVDSGTVLPRMFFPPTNKADELLADISGYGTAG